MEDEHHRHDADAEPFKDGADICQQLMDRYSKSSAPQHHHLLATAAAIRSILAAESLPLTPPSYFAATISSIDDMSSRATADPTAVAALLSFLSLVLPAAPPRSISLGKAGQALSMLAEFLERGEERLTMTGVKAVVKCLGALVGFCDLEDWQSVKLGLETLLKFSVDKRPKVRKCSQECLENVFKLLQSRSVVKEASKLILSMLKGYMPLAVKLSASRTSDGHKNLDVLHMLNVVKLTVPFLSAKVSSKLLSEMNKLLGPRFSELTRHVFQIIQVLFEISRADDIVSKTEGTIPFLISYVSLANKNPSDTVMSAATLLKYSIGILHTAESTSWITNLPLVCGSVAGLLASEARTASHSSDILKELISHHVDISDEGEDLVKSNALRSICAIFEEGLNLCKKLPNDHLLDAISALFLKLGNMSHIYMKSIMLKLAELMTAAIGEKSNVDHLQKCIGTAVIAMGPGRLLELVPVSLNAGEFTCVNIWLVPILKNYVVGAPLAYYMDNIMPLANSFHLACNKVKKSKTREELQGHARDLSGLLLSFCRHPTDMYHKFIPLAEVMVKFLKEDSLMHETVACSLQALVNQNKSAVNQKTGAAEATSELVPGLRNIPIYSKKIATKNIKAVAQCSLQLLEALIDTFVGSAPEKRPYLKDAIRCLASVADSSIAKKIFISVLEKFHLMDGRNECVKVESETNSSGDEEEHNRSTGENNAQRCVIMELASSLVEGAQEDLIDLIYTFIKHTFQTSEEVANREAYYTLSRILEEHAWFCSSQSTELIDLLLRLKSPGDIVSLRSRFSCFQTLMIHTLKIEAEVENAKAFLILNEIIVTLKDSHEEKARKTAYDTLLNIRSGLRDLSSLSSDGPYQKLINMIMGYLSGASPHIKSGAVSVLSVLVYKDTDICLSVPELIPSLLSLLQGKALEVIKAVLGFVKVLVSCLETRRLQDLLPAIVTAVLPWSPVSRHHFREKVTIIMEIMLRKCGPAGVELVTPDKYKGFVRGVLENRRDNKKSSKEVATTETDVKQADSSTNRMEDRKRKEMDPEHENKGSMEHRKRRREKELINGKPSTSSTYGISSWGRDETKRARRPRQSDTNKSFQDQSEINGKTIRENYSKRPTGGRKGKIGKTGTGKDVTAIRRPGTTTKLFKAKKVGKN
ncbi:uncharacterized protein LOC126800497 [Argentina anserina]|uniref:uncharacterized protein LOC126800497 n=1 Tax=Argentina anserina TaxID=57926 RepID=UPI0021763360|nr:uncharacterized protein LOC126800497 [Potentilla anserina]